LQTPASSTVRAIANAQTPSDLCVISKSSTARRTVAFGLDEAGLERLDDDGRCPSRESNAPAASRRGRLSAAARNSRTWVQRANQVRYSAAKADLDHAEPGS